MYYISTSHKQRFERTFKERYHQCSLKYLAAVYLLYADLDLRLATSNAVYERAIKFSAVKYSALTAEQYTLFRAAQDIYTGSNYITLQDLVDSGVIRPQIYRAILQALQIARGEHMLLSAITPFDVPQKERGEG